MPWKKGRSGYTASMKNLFHTVKKAFCSRELYLVASTESAWKGFRVLMRLGLLIGLALGVVSFIALLIWFPSLKEKLTTFATVSYPDALVITITDGVLTATPKDSVFVPMPPEFQTDDTPSNLFVLAPDEGADLSVLERYDTAAAATRNAIIVSTDDETRVYEYSKEPQTITKTSFLATMATVTKFGSVFVYIAVVPLALLYMVFHIGLHLLWLFVLIAILWVVCKLIRRPYTYKALYRMGIYALIPVLLVEIIAVPLHFSGKLLTTAIVSLIMVIVTSVKPAVRVQESIS
jgi:hypothetical protein